MRISDWSSDVCSSDLLVAEPDAVHHHRIAVGPAACRQSPGALGQLAKAEAGPQELQIEVDLLPREAIEPALRVARPAVAAEEDAVDVGAVAAGADQVGIEAYDVSGGDDRAAPTGVPG